MTSRIATRTRPIRADHPLAADVARLGLPSLVALAAILGCRKEVLSRPLTPDVRARLDALTPDAPAVVAARAKPQPRLGRTPGPPTRTVRLPLAEAAALAALSPEARAALVRRATRRKLSTT